MLGQANNCSFVETGSDCGVAERARRRVRSGRLLHAACLEALEQRVLLSVNVTQQGDMLFILGDSGNDTVRET